MATEIENGTPLSPEELAEAEKYKEQANEFFKSKFFIKNLLTSSLKNYLFRNC